MKKENDWGLLIKLKSARDLGLGIRRTEDINGIVKEAEGLGTIREIPIDNKRSFVVFTTISASPHTPIAVSYESYYSFWEGNGETYNYKLSKDKELLPKEDKTGAFVPLHLITWAVVKTINKDGQFDYQECDIYDLVGEGKRFDKKRLFTLADLDDNHRRRILWEFWSEIEKRMNAHDEILGQMYTNFFLPKIQESISSLGVNDDLKEQILSIFSNTNGLVDHGLPVGHYSRWREDRLGRGPQSNPNFHFHSVIYFFPEKLWKVIEGSNYEDKVSLFEQVLGFMNQSLIGGEIVWLKGEANRNDSIRAKIPEIMMKQIDPYSAIVYRRGGRSFLLKEIQRIIEETGINASLKSFFHHTNMDRLGDSRFAQGIEVEISDNDFVKFMTHFNIFLNDLYRIWGLVQQALKIKEFDIKAYQEILVSLKGFNLPEAVFSLVDDLVPVSGDLSFNSNKIFASFAHKEIKGGSNYQGYNIPGVPGLGLTFEFKNGNVVIYISPILSKKGLAEQIVGLPVERIEASS